MNEKPYTRFNFKDKTLTIYIYPEGFDKYILYDSIKDFIDEKFKDSKIYKDLTLTLAKAIVFSENNFEKVFYNLYESMTNLLSKTYIATNSDSNEYYLRDIFHLLSIHGNKAKNKDVRLIEDVYKQYGELSYSVDIQKFDNILVGDVVQIINIMRPGYLYKGIVVSKRLYSSSYVYNVYSERDGICRELGQHEVMKINKDEL